MLKLKKRLLELIEEADEIENTLAQFKILMEKLTVQDPLKTLLLLLTEKENEILNRMAENENLTTIAAAMNVSKKTIGSHRFNILKKLRLESLRDLKTIVIPRIKNQKH